MNVVPLLPESKIPQLALEKISMEAEVSLDSFARRVAASAAAGSETSWFSLPFEPGALTFAEPLMTGWLLHMLWLTCEGTRIWISAAFLF